MKSVFIFLLLSGAAYYSIAQSPSATHFNHEPGKPFIDGFDVVSYFNGDPKKGRKELSHTHEGILYLFSTIENREDFKSDPDRYIPAYGGWCAFAMGDTGEKVKIDPETYKIIDDKLYLFYNFFFNNTLNDWNKDEKRLKTSADSNWLNTVKSISK